MTPEELMIARIKVTAPWPGMFTTQVGDIINEADVMYLCLEEADTLDEALNIYPHLFRKMQWWEERMNEDMPDYVKCGNHVYKVSEWDGTGSPDVFINDVQREEFVWDRGYETAPLYECFPATESEYQQYRITL